MKKDGFFYRSMHHIVFQHFVSSLPKLCDFVYQLVPNCLVSKQFVFAAKKIVKKSDRKNC